MIKRCNFLRHQLLDIPESELRPAEDIKLSTCWEATQPYLCFCIFFLLLFLPLHLLFVLIFAFVFAFAFIFLLHLLFDFMFDFVFPVLIGSIYAKKRENNKRKNFIQEELQE